jgi:hypothetical protein
MNSIEIKELCIIGKAMGLHDFRRAAATFLAMDAPEKIGLIPGLLQHDSPEVNERHNNLARSVQAGKRFAAHPANARIKAADARKELRTFGSSLPPMEEVEAPL